MAGKQMDIALRLTADAARFVRGITGAGSSVKRFVSQARSQFDSLRQAMGTLKGQAAALGLSYGAMAMAAQSARMDKSLTQIGQTAGMTAAEVEKLRDSLFEMGKATGTSVDDLQSGFNNAVQAGLSFREALPVVEAVNTAVAVTGASAEQLTSGLTVAASAFQFDLATPGQALELLDKMLVAGRLGNAELENLSAIFARVGVNAKAAGMSFDSTLAFVEVLSQTEKAPERLATLADSTLRIFTNLNYMKAASKATGVKFFDAKGSRRDATAVLLDMKKQYDKLGNNELKQSLFMQKAFGKADLDTIKGLRTLFGGKSLEQLKDFAKEIEAAGGTLEKDLPAAIANAVDQTGRLKNALRHAADDFARPVNQVVADAIKFLMGTRDKEGNLTSGLGLSGGQLAVGGAVAGLGLIVGGKLVGRGLGSLLDRYTGTAKGVAEGKALQAATGVTPVFVTNFPAGLASGGSDIPGAAASVGGAAAGAVGLSAGAIAGIIAVAGAIHIGGYAALSEREQYEANVAYNEGFDPNAIAEALNTPPPQQELKGAIKIDISDNRTTVTTSTSTPGVNYDVDSGPVMTGY
ncbi:MAG: phage tail tape measure protein [Oxalobacter formigenes]|nr:phage tail tape measure protein [Oxalobacter formigenes]